MQLDPDICELYRRSKLSRYLFACSMSASFISYEQHLSFHMRIGQFLICVLCSGPICFRFFFG